MIGRALAALAAHQGLVTLAQKAERDIKYQQASATAHRFNKPMLVVGGPFGVNPFRSFFGMKAHG